MQGRREHSVKIRIGSIGRKVKLKRSVVLMMMMIRGMEITRRHWTQSIITSGQIREPRRCKSNVVWWRMKHFDF